MFDMKMWTTKTRKIEKGDGERTLNYIKEVD